MLHSCSHCHPDACMHDSLSECSLTKSIRSKFAGSGPHSNVLWGWYQWCCSSCGSRCRHGCGCYRCHHCSSRYHHSCFHCRYTHVIYNTCLLTRSKSKDCTCSVSPMQALWWDIYVRSFVLLSPKHIHLWSHACWPYTSASTFACSCAKCVQAAQYANISIEVVTPTWCFTCCRNSELHQDWQICSCNAAESVQGIADMLLPTWYLCCPSCQPLSINSALYVAVYFSLPVLFGRGQHACLLDGWILTCGLTGTLPSILVVFYNITQRLYNTVLWLESQHLDAHAAFCNWLHNVTLLLHTVTTIGLQYTTHISLRQRVLIWAASWSYES